MAVLITDSVLLCGCKEGTKVYNSSGMMEQVVDGKIMNVEYNCLAGSSLALCRGVKNYMEFAGVSLDEAVKCAGENPMRCTGLDVESRCVKKGAKANFTLFDKDGNLLKTFYNGKCVFSV